MGDGIRASAAALLPRPKRGRASVSLTILGFLALIVLETQVHIWFYPPALSFETLREKCATSSPHNEDASQSAAAKLTHKPYRIKQSIKDEYKQWHSTVRKLSEMDRFPSNWKPYVDWNHHPRLRSKRFPSVEERIDYYMGKWYNSSISMYGMQFDRDTYIQRQSTIQYGAFADILVNLYDLDKDRLTECYQNKKELQVFAPYCRDYIDIAILHSNGLANVIHFIGDALPSFVPDKLAKYPMFAKVRPLCNNRGRYGNSYCKNDQTLQPIILPLNRKRHLGVAADVTDNDIPWEEKKPLAVWRGKYDKVDTASIAQGSISGSSYMKYALVSKHLNSSLIDAKFSKHHEDAPAEMIGSYLAMKEQLKYRYIISIEGNDVSSGLKWMLLSNSVVLAPRFTWESWAMEGTLEPFLHYIPINEDMSNVEEMIVWAESHPDESRLIAERSTLFIYDLLFHPDAIEDERLVIEGIMEVYENNFGMGSIERGDYFNAQLHKQLTRAERFPSVDERVQYYMGYWSSRHNSVSMKRETLHQVKTLIAAAGLANGSVFIASGSDLLQCSLRNETHASMQELCDSALPYFDERHTADLKSNSFKRLLKAKNGIEMKYANHSSWRNDSKGIKESKRVLLDDTVKVINFGTSSDLDVPSFSTWRYSDSKRGSILWPFGLSDTFWAQDRLGIVDSDFISKHAATIRLEIAINAETMPLDVIQNALRYRYLVFSQEQGCTDLSWMLLSNSVVLMPKPKCESWLMETTLQPFEHYIPIDHSMSNVNEMMNWAEKNLQQTATISRQSTQFIYDLRYHPDALKDEKLIMERIMGNYKLYFG